MVEIEIAVNAVNPYFKTHAVSLYSTERKNSLFGIIFNWI